MTYIEFNLIRVISAGIITAAISTAYCSFAYLLHGPLFKVHLTPIFFSGLDETLQHSHKEFDKGFKN